MIPCWCHKCFHLGAIVTTSVACCWCPDVIALNHYKHWKSALKANPIQTLKWLQDLLNASIFILHTDIPSCPPSPTSDWIHSFRSCLLLCATHSLFFSHPSATKAQLKSMPCLLRLFPSCIPLPVLDIHREPAHFSAGKIKKPQQRKDSAKRDRFISLAVTASTGQMLWFITQTWMQQIQEAELQESRCQKTPNQQVKHTQPYKN